MILPKAMMAPLNVSAEADLVIRARKGDPTALEELVAEHREAAFFLALQLLGNREDALDVTQDVLLRFLGNLHRFDPRRPVRPWLYRIVRNRVIDLYRRRKVRAHESLDAVDDEGSPRYDPADPDVDVERDLTRTRLRARIWKALDELPPAHREILVLRDYQDMSYSEIADALSIPMGTVMSRLHGARKSLRRVLGENPLITSALKSTSSHPQE